MTKHRHRWVCSIVRDWGWLTGARLLDVTGDDRHAAMICETASFVLLDSIRWLYMVPSFKELTGDDQLILIEQSWSLLFLVASAEMKKFLDPSETHSLLPNVQRTSHSDQIEALDDDEQFSSFQSLVQELAAHAMDQTEYTLLKLILIFTNRESIIPFTCASL